MGASFSGFKIVDGTLSHKVQVLHESPKDLLDNKERDLVDVRSKTIAFIEGGAFYQASADSKLNSISSGNDFIYLPSEVQGRNYIFIAKPSPMNINTKGVVLVVPPSMQVACDAKWR